MAESPELTFRLAQVEKDLEREAMKREEGNKYTHRMVEDVQSRYHEIALSFGRMEAAFVEHTKDDKQMVESMGGLDKRMRTIERLVWIAMGGLAVLGGLVGVYGTYILNLLRP